MKREEELRHALSAIRARINGEWDNISLNDFGLLSESVIVDVLLIADSVLMEEV